MDNIINEGKIKGAVDALPLEKLEKICDQMKTCICKIYGQMTGTGFFCKIPYNNKEIPVLMTNYHVLNNDFINNNKKITITINNEKIIDILDVNEKSIVYSSPTEKYDIMIIRLKEEDKYHYLDLEEKIFDENALELYKEKSIYILHYPSGEQLSVSFGFGVTKLEGEYYVKHLCNTEDCSSGSPILNLFTNKVIGIHKGRHGANTTKYNLGIFLKDPLDEVKKNKIENIDDGKIKNLSKDGNLPDIMNIPKEKEEIFNNIIYYDDTFYTNNSNDKEDVEYIENITPGAFILCANFSSLDLIKNEIIFEHERNENTKFNLIITENSYYRLIRNINLIEYFENFIDKICIVCKNPEIIENSNNYDIIYGIAQNKTEIKKFIEFYSSKDIKPFSLEKLITYKDYNNKYRIYHKKISEFYGDLTPNSYKYYLEQIKRLINEESTQNKLGRNQNKILQGFLTFDINIDQDSSNQLVIKEFTKDTIYFDLQRWLRNWKMKSYDSISYFTSRLMYSLNSYGNKYKKFYNKNQVISKAGYKLPFSYLLQYERNLGKIILFSSFISTSAREIIAQGYSGRGESRDLYERCKKFSVIYIINNNYRNNWISSGINIKDVSEFGGEDEIIYQPFSFFLLKDIIIDYENYIADIYLETIGKTEILEEEIKKGKKILYNNTLGIMEAKQWN